MLTYVLLQAGGLLFSLISLLVFINVIMSWLRLGDNYPFVRLIHSLTEPLLAPFRKFCVFGMFDFSPYALILVLQLIVQPLYRWLIITIF